MPILSNRRARIGAAVLIPLLGSLLTFFTPTAGAQSKCSGDQSIDWVNRSITSGRGKGGVLDAPPLTGVLSEPIPAGSYSIRTYSSEFKPDRAGEEAQPDESWTAVFLGAAGNEVGRTPHTSDVPDGVNLGEAFDTFTITLSGTATNVRVDHKILDRASPANSVSPSCIGIRSLAAAPAPTTTAAPATTVPPTTTEASVLSQTTLRPTTAPPVTLPRTGGAAQNLAVVVGFGLLASGIALVSSTRRRTDTLV